MDFNIAATGWFLFSTGTMCLVIAAASESKNKFLWGTGIALTGVVVLKMLYFFLFGG